MNRSLYVLSALAAVVLAVAAVWGVQGTSAASEPALRTDEALFFDVTLRDEKGSVLATPRLLGQAGRPTRLTLSRLGDDPADAPRRMQLVLDPLAAVGGLDLALELSLEGIVDHHQVRARMPVGRLQTFRIPTEDGRELDLTLLAVRVDSPAFESWVEALRERAAARRRPEA